MPASYLVLSWPAAAADLGAAADRLSRTIADAGGWTEAAAASGLRVWARGGHAPAVSPLPGGGRLVGRLFGGAPPTGGGGAAPPAAARALAGAAWGRYVALFPDPGGGPAWSLRDPSGALEAFRWTRDGVGLLADDLDGVPPALAPPALAVDWDAVGEALARPISVFGRCALTGVEALAPGEVAPLGGGRAAAVWRPADAVGREAPAGLEAALADTVADACARMAAAHKRILVECSGGLDSSIVVGLLGRGPARGRVAAAVNQYAPQAEADERPWARAACAGAGLRLLEVEKPQARFELEDFTALAGGVRPAVGGLDVVRDRMLTALAGELGAQAIMTGQGGDGVFFQMPAGQVAGDLLAALGPRALADPRVAELCRWLRRSAWSVWREVLWPPRRRPGEAAHLWGPPARARRAHPAHPWLAGLEDLPPAKRVQVEYLAFCQIKHGRSLRADRLAVLHPLLSQPVMELCLAIPSWALVRGGRDRGLARDAFAPILPEAVAGRRSKGELSTLYTRRAAASLDVLRPLLLEGALAEAGLLDRAAADAALTPEGLIWRGDGLRLLHAAAVEAWVRHWQGRIRASAPRAAA